MRKDHSDCSRVAQHALILGSGYYVKPKPVVPAQPDQSSDSTLQSDSRQETVQSKLFMPDKLGNVPFNMNKDENLTCLLDYFHRDRPKGCGGIPFGNLSLVVQQLTKALFETLKEVCLKCLTYQTTFLLALSSGKCRSEIHAWLNRNIRLVQGVCLPLTQFSFREPIDQRESRMCGTSGYSCPMPQLWINHSRLSGVYAQLEPNTTTWIRPQTDKRTGLCLL